MQPKAIKILNAQFLQIKKNMVFTWSRVINKVILYQHTLSLQGPFYSHLKTLCQKRNR